MTGLQGVADISCRLGRQSVLVSLVVGRMEQCPPVDFLLPWRLVFLHVSEIVNLCLGGLIGLGALLLGLGLLYKLQFLRPVRFLALGRGAVGLPYRDLFPFLGEIHKYALLLRRRIDVCNSGKNAENGRGDVDRHRADNGAD